MKELDKTKAYDLRDLNNEQKDVLLNWLQKEEPDSNWDYFNISSNFLYSDDKEWFETYNLLGLSGFYNELINALTLFEPQLKIGDTFEKDGFICRVESVKKEPIKVGDWIMNDRKMFFKYEKWMCDSPLWVKITDQEFIKQLEKHAR